MVYSYDLFESNKIMQEFLEYIVFYNGEVFYLVASDEKVLTRNS